MVETPQGLVELKYFPDYGATPDGRIWSRKSGAWRALKLSNVRGYLKVNVIDIDGKVRTRKAHLLTAFAFLGECPEGREVNHEDGCKANNVSTNLEYVTHQVNMQHSVNVLGNQHGCPLTTEQVAAKRRRDRAHRMRRLAYRLWILDGRRALPHAARAAMKLTEAVVVEIRGHAAARTMTRRAMATHYRVSKNTIDRIVSREKWAHA